MEGAGKLLSPLLLPLPPGGDRQGSGGLEGVGGEGQEVKEEVKEEGEGGHGWGGRLGYGGDLDVGKMGCIKRGEERGRFSAADAA